jgi:hypothetical protein
MPDRTRPTAIAPSDDGEAALGRRCDVNPDELELTPTIWRSKLRRVMSPMAGGGLLTMS